MPAEPTNTARAFFDYTVGGEPHSLMVRFVNDAAAVAGVGSFHAVLAANVAAFGDNVLWTGARIANQGTNVTNPVSWDLIEGTDTPIDAWDFPLFVSFYGRSADGTKARWYFYGVRMANPPGDYRIDGESFPDVTALLTDFQDWADEANVVTIGATPPVIANYANVGYNAYHQRKARA